MKKKNLSNIVRLNLKWLRERYDMTQEEFSRPIMVANKGKGAKAELVSIGRSGYNKKETGKSVITLEDLDCLMDAYPWLKLPQIFMGHPDLTSVPAQDTTALSKQAKEKFWALAQAVELANRIADEPNANQERLKTLLQTIELARSEIESIN
jgi:transcriptional regulator with XRE-family HTH domain